MVFQQFFALNSSKLENSKTDIGNAIHAVRTQCKIFVVSNYLNPSFGPFSQSLGEGPVQRAGGGRGYWSLGKRCT